MQLVKIPTVESRSPMNERDITLTRYAQKVFKLLQLGMKFSIGCSAVRTLFVNKVDDSENIQSVCWLLFSLPLPGATRSLNSGK